MEPIEEVPLKELCESELEISAWLTEKPGVDSRARRGEAYWKERSVIRREDDVDGRANVTTGEEQMTGWEHPNST